MSKTYGAYCIGYLCSCVAGVSPRWPPWYGAYCIGYLCSCVAGVSPRWPPWPWVGRRSPLQW